jgi:hypothetical protein
MKASLAACSLALVCATTPAEEFDPMTLPKGKLVYKSVEEPPADTRAMFLREAERVQKATLLSGMPYAVFQVSESMTNVVRAQQEQALATAFRTTRVFAVHDCTAPDTSLYSAARNGVTVNKE